MNYLSNHFILMNKTCRICTSDSGNMVNLFRRTVTEQKLWLYELYTEIMNLPVAENDGYPNGVCKNCTQRLVDAYLLKRLAESSTHIFRTMKAQLTTIKLEIQIDEDKIAKNIGEEAAEEEENEEGKPPKVCHANGVEFLVDETQMVDRAPERRSWSDIERKHECQVCHKKFLRKSNLVDHLRLHANVKLFKCEYCDKAFVQSGNYKSHLRTHTNERPFTCSFCSKSYNQSSALKIHIRTHTNERNYICDICTKAFTNASDLGKHKRVHDPDKQIKCEYCKRSFAQKANLRSHQMNNHREEMLATERSSKLIDK